MQCLLGRWFYEFHCFGRLAHTSSKSTIKKTPANDTIINYKTDRRALFFKLIKKKFPCDFFFRPLFFFPPCLPLSIFGRKLMAEKNRSSSQDIPTHCVVVVAPNPLECIPESSTRPAHCRIRRWSVSRSMCTTRKKTVFHHENEIFWVECFLFSLFIHVSLHRHHPNGYDKNSNSLMKHCTHDEDESRQKWKLGEKSTRKCFKIESRHRRLFTTNPLTCVLLFSFEGESERVHCRLFFLLPQYEMRRDARIMWAMSRRSLFNQQISVGRRSIKCLSRNSDVRGVVMSARLWFVESKLMAFS